MTLSHHWTRHDAARGRAGRFGRGPRHRGARGAGAPLLLTVLLAMLPGGLAAPALAQDAAALVHVDAVRTARANETVPVLGRLVAKQAGVVSARIEGVVERLPVQVGDKVVAGQVVAELDASELEIERSLTRDRLSEAQARIAVDEAEFAMAQGERVRLQELRKTQATSASLYDDSVHREAIAKAEVASARAAADAARTAVAAAELRLGWTRVRAPYPGVITQRLTEAGTYLPRGASVVRLLAAEALEVEVEVPYRYVDGLVPGTGVGVSLEDSDEYPGVVRAVLPEESRRTATRVVRIVPELGAADRLLAAGQRVTVTIPTGPAREVLSVHKDAITKQGGRDLVFVVEGDVAKPRTVHLGNAIGDRFVILDGLEVGDLVVVRGNERLRPNTKVRIDKGTS